MARRKELAMTQMTNVAILAEKERLPIGRIGASEQSVTAVHRDLVRLLGQCHASFLWSPIRLPAIAGFACGHEVIPCGLTATSSRPNVIESERAWTNRRIAILTPATIALQDAAARNGSRHLRQLGVVEQSDHTGNRDRELRRTDECARLPFDYGIPLEDKSERPACGDDIDRDIGRVNH